MTTRPKTIECERCGSGVSVMSRGPVPRYCSMCRKRGAVRATYNREPLWQDSREAQARAVRGVMSAPNGNRPRRELDPLAKPVLLDSPFSIDERSVRFHHRKTRAKGVAFTVLWLAVVAVILVVVLLVFGPGSFGTTALHLG